VWTSDADLGSLANRGDVTPRVPIPSRMIVRLCVCALGRIVSIVALS
jgi:hypothetical protein